MYKILIRPLLFLFSPEKIHHWLVSIVRFAYRIPSCPAIMDMIFSFDKPELKKQFLGLEFKNQVGLAAGFDKDAAFYEEFGHFGFGFIEIGTITPKAQPGNPKPRSFRLPDDRALVNRMGLNNMGVDEAVSRLKKKRNGLIIGGNIAKNTDTPMELAKDDFVYCFENLYDWVDYFVINVSCPNTGEITKLQDQTVMEDIFSEIMAKRAFKSPKKPVLLKISPDLNFEQIDEVLNIVKKYQIDGIVATNTTISREGLSASKSRLSSVGNGGLSGAPLSKKSTEIIRYITAKTNGNLPIIGVGGIMSVEDAMEKLKAGAGLIQIYTGFVYEGPFFVKRILKSILCQIVDNR